MKRLILSLSIISLAATGAAAQTVRKPAEPPLVINDQAPAAVVRELYKVHRKGYGPLFEKRGRKLHEKFFDARLAELIWKDLTETPQGEVGHLDGDPLYNAQDIRIKNFRVGDATVNGDTAVVPVTFVNYDRKERLEFHLVRTKGVWKISNIDYGGGSNLLKILTGPM